MINLRKAVWFTVHPNKYAHGFCFAVLCCGYTLTDFQDYQEKDKSFKIQDRIFVLLSIIYAFNDAANI